VIVEIDNPVGYDGDNERYARANTPTDVVVEMFFGTGPGQLHINKFEFYAPQYFGALHNANVGAGGCDLYPRLSELTPHAPRRQLVTSRNGFVVTGLTPTLSAR
jgi:hypothetical protein